MSFKGFEILVEKKISGLIGMPFNNIDFCLLVVDDYIRTLICLAMEAGHLPNWFKAENKKYAYNSNEEPGRILLFLNGIRDYWAEDPFISTYSDDGWLKLSTSIPDWSVVSSVGFQGPLWYPHFEFPRITYGES